MDHGKAGVKVTRPYKDLFSFDSNQVKCLGLIKDLVVSLAQIPSKSLVMDVVVADSPPKFGMLLSRSWAAKLKGALQMDMSYATKMAYMVSNVEQPNNHPIYSLDAKLGSAILLNEEEKERLDLQNPSFVPTQM